MDQHAVNCIIDTVRANPGQVTIAAIGPCGNLALAVRMAPDIVPLIRRVVYMGGSFFQQGNTTPAAEFNWYFDPEAARFLGPAERHDLLAIGAGEVKSAACNTKRTGPQGWGRFLERFNFKIVGLD